MFLWLNLQGCDLRLRDGIVQQPLLGHPWGIENIDVKGAVLPLADLHFLWQVFEDTDFRVDKARLARNADGHFAAFVVLIVADFIRVFLEITPFYLPHFDDRDGNDRGDDITVLVEFQQVARVFRQIPVYMDFNGRAVFRAVAFTCGFDFRQVQTFLAFRSAVTARTGSFAATHAG